MRHRHLARGEAKPHTPFSGNPRCAWGTGVSPQRQTSSACVCTSRGHTDKQGASSGVCVCVCARARTRQPAALEICAVNVNGARCGSRENDKQMRSEGRYAHVSRLISMQSSHRCRPPRSLRKERNNSKLKHDHCGIQGRFNVQTSAKTSRFTGMGGPRVCFWLHLALKCKVFVRAARKTWL